MRVRQSFLKPALFRLSLYLTPIMYANYCYFLHGIVVHGCQLVTVRICCLRTSLCSISMHHVTLIIYGGRNFFHISRLRALWHFSIRVVLHTAG